MTGEQQCFSGNSSGISTYGAPNRLMAEQLKVSMNNHSQHQQLQTFRHYHNHKAGDAHAHAQLPLHHQLQNYASAHHQSPHAWWHTMTALGATPSAITAQAATATVAAGGVEGVLGGDVSAATAIYASNATKRGEHFL
uniref:Uncharacterized protein n=1 Tax=Bactrocera dorsalis TaxID=27457 RepID=A0A034W3P4_BACDO